MRKCNFSNLLQKKKKHTHTHTFSGKRIFRLSEIRNVENHRNLGVEKFNRYQAFSLRKYTCCDLRDFDMIIRTKDVLKTMRENGEK